MEAGDPGGRRAELARSLVDLRRRVHDACVAVGRQPSEVTLIAVTKTFPVEDAAVLLDLGVGDLGENRDQEARVKAAAVPGARWHFVGQLQTNKARSVASYAHAVHSVDRPALALALDEATVRADRAPLPVFVQVSLDNDIRRGGVAPSDVDELAEYVAGLSSLRLAGVMAVAPFGVDVAAAFGELQEVSARVRAGHPAAVSVSAGMSADLESAIAAGSTHIRIGSALLGGRAPEVG